VVISTVLLSLPFVSCDVVDEGNFPTFQMYCGIEDLSWLTSGL